jgi:starch phosphorylase
MTEAAETTAAAEKAFGPEAGVAYFSMEVYLESGMPTYSGGLGVLAGDTIGSAADLKVPMVAVTLLHRKGYFHQKLDPGGWQTEEPVDWVVGDFLRELPQRASVTIEGREVRLRAWVHDVLGIAGFKVPVYFLDADLDENTEWDRALTGFLYGGDQHYRLCQEVILGIGGVRMLRALGYTGIRRFHLNEGHSSLLALELLDEEARKGGKQAITLQEVDAVRGQCVFTTHTPVAAGQDQFPMDLVERVLGRRDIYTMKEVFCCEGLLNMTFLALNLSHYVNGVAKRHGEVSRLMFARYAIDAITNGVRAATWVSSPFQDLYDRHIPGWKEDNFNLRYAIRIPNQDLWESHSRAKGELIRRVNRETNAGMDVDVFTLGFARRATAYKRADLILRDIERLRRMGRASGGLQLVFAGKAHPRDTQGKDLIRRIVQARDALKGDVRIAYLANYDADLARLMTAGADVWLNTPEPPLEASGTSGMKAAMNGVPSLSILDGWWVEGCIEGVTGWAIGDDGGTRAHDGSMDAAYLHDKLEKVVLPLFYAGRDRFIDVMRHAIALNGSFFNTQRMIQQYVVKAYFL